MLCVSMQESMHACMHMWRPEQDIGIFFCCSWLYCLETRSLIEPDIQFSLSRLASKLSSSACLFNTAMTAYLAFFMWVPRSQTSLLRHCKCSYPLSCPPVPQPGFCVVGSGELNSHSHACKTGTLPAEPSAQSSSDFIFEISGLSMILGLDIFYKIFDQSFLFLLHVLIHLPRLAIGENR